MTTCWDFELRVVLFEPRRRVNHLHHGADVDTERCPCYTPRGTQGWKRDILMGVLSWFSYRPLKNLEDVQAWFTTTRGIYKE